MIFFIDINFILLMLKLIDKKRTLHYITTFISAITSTIYK